LRRRKEGERRYSGDASPEWKFAMMNLYWKLRSLMLREEGQDLVEYALVVALIAFGAVVGMGSLAQGINDAFSSIGTQLTSHVSN
jgi:pilus assembly protein Flp/PilA